jgi:hypothetical protein
MKEMMRRLQLPCLMVWLPLIIALIPSMVLAVEDEIHATNEFSVTSNNTSGEGRDRSSLTKGTKYLDILSLYGNGKLGTFDYNWTTGAKSTNDERNDIKRISLTNLQGKMTNKVNTLTIGDVFESFSQYALNTALKGESYRLSPEGAYIPKVTLIYGYASPRWDAMDGDDAIKRRVIGGKVKQDIGQKWTIGLSHVEAKDEERMPYSDKVDEKANTFDWEYRPITGLTVQGESSWISGTTSPAAGTYEDFDGDAHKITAVGDGGPSRVSIEYEQVSPEYNTVAGSATPDRERFKGKWRYKYTKNLTITTTMLWYRDNLDSQKEFTTNHYKPEIGVSVKKIFGRQYGVADVSYRMDMTKSDETDANDHYINTTYTDRFGMLDSTTNLGVTRYDTAGVTKATEYTYNTNLSSRHTLTNVVLKPSLYLGGWTSSQELDVERTTDRIYEYSLGLGLDVPSANITSNMKAGENRLEKENGTDSTRPFASLNIFWRPDFLAKAKGMFYAKGYINSYRYDPNAGEGSRNFRESSITLGINVQY